jgi:plasmid stability protein
MPSITIRNVSPEAHRRLRIRAAENGRSLQEEVKNMIDAETTKTKDSTKKQVTSWVDEMRSRIMEFGYVDFVPATADESIDVTAFAEPDFTGKDFTGKDFKK